MSKENKSRSGDPVTTHSASSLPMPVLGWEFYGGVIFMGRVFMEFFLWGVFIESFYEEFFYGEV